LSSGTASCSWSSPQLHEQPPAEKPALLSDHRRHAAEFPPCT
jgi:hypothetical protein